MTSKMCDCNQGRMACSCKPELVTVEMRPRQQGRTYEALVQSQARVRELLAEISRLKSEKPVPVALKYDDTLLPFLAFMRRELHSNSRKGDRAGWLRMGRNEALQEIHHHVKKLDQVVVMDGGLEQITEHAADVANCAMMLLDVCGGIPPADDGQADEVMCRGDWGLGTACERCSRCEQNDPAKGWIMTLVTHCVRKDHHTYWFGRLDRKDEMRPTRIEALNGQIAWRELRKQLSVENGKARDA